MLNKTYKKTAVYFFSIVVGSGLIFLYIYLLDVLQKIHYSLPLLSFLTLIALFFSYILASEKVRKSKLPPPISLDENKEGNASAISAVQFALELGHGDCGLEFLRAWNEGDFNSIRKEWPEAPENVFIGVDPLYKVENN